MVTRYEKRLSGPLLDRVDLHVDVPRVEFDKLTAGAATECSTTVRERVVAARERQWERFRQTPEVTCNADMRLAEIRRWCELDGEAASLIRSAVQRLGLSARAYHRVLRLGRTIADLGGSDRITSTHLAEAVQYQPRGAVWDQ